MFRFISLLRGLCVAIIVEL